MYANMKRMNNDMAVSPIVATLVLIVVAVIGAVAVGTIMGTFSTSVSKNVNAQQASSASQSEILVAGSTTVDPITRAAAGSSIPLPTPVSRLSPRQPAAVQAFRQSVRV